MSLQFAAPDDGATVVHDGIARARLGCAGFIIIDGSISVAAEVSVGVDFETIVPVRVQCYFLRPRRFHVLHEVDNGVSVGQSRVLGETGALIRHIRNIRPGALLQ